MFNIQIYSFIFKYNYNKYLLINNYLNYQIYHILKTVIKKKKKSYNHVTFEYIIYYR